MNDIRIRAGGEGLEHPRAGHGAAAPQRGRDHVPPPARRPRRSAPSSRASAAAPAAEEPRNSLARALHAAGVERPRARRAASASAWRARRRREASDPRDFVSRALAATDEAFQNLAAGRVPNPLPLRRLVTELLERGPRRRGAVGGARRRPRPTPCTSCAWRSSRSSSGASSRLPQSVLQDLGVAALYHDCGYAAGSAALGRGGRLVRAPRARRGRASCCASAASTRRRCAGCSPILQHHRDANDRLHPGLFGRILRVAEDYDTLARRSGKLSPTMALAAMLKWAGTRYDAVLLQLLVNALGAYPPGTLLKLEDGRVVRSAAPARGPETFAHAPRPLPAPRGRLARPDRPAPRGPARRRTRSSCCAPCPDGRGRASRIERSAWPSAGRSRRIAPCIAGGRTDEAHPRRRPRRGARSRPRSPPPRASRPRGRRSSP